MTDRRPRGPLDVLRSVGRSFFDLFFPRRCAGCQESWLSAEEGFWCRNCLDELPWIGSPLCPRCGRPFPKAASSPDHPCGDCLLSVFPFDSARSATQHSGVVRDRIHQLKFGAQLHWVPPLAELLVRTLGRDPLTQQTAHVAHMDFILPVPLHVKRLRQRGFNQAGLVARVLSQRLGLPVRFDLLVRKSWTEPQTRLNRQERLRNVEDAFGALRPAELKDRRVLLVDDVYTTGTTLSECTKTLKEAGTAEVHAVTVSRALPDWKT